jgi:hypothetical protein
MDERDQSLAGGLVPFPPLEKERGDIGGVRGNPGILGATITFPLPEPAGDFGRRRSLR